MNIKFEVTNLTRKHLIIALSVFFATAAIAGVGLYAANRAPTNQERMAAIDKQEREIKAQEKAKKEEYAKINSGFIDLPVDVISLYVFRDLDTRGVLNNTNSLTNDQRNIITQFKIRANEWVYEKGFPANDILKASKGDLTSNQVAEPYLREWDAMLLRFLDEIKDFYTPETLPQSLDKK